MFTKKPLLFFNSIDVIKNKKVDIVNYNYRRYVLAKEHNFNIFNIWADEWEFKQDIIKSL